MHTKPRVCAEFRHYGIPVPKVVDSLVVLAVGSVMAPVRGLKIREPWLTKILLGTKTWELRGKATRVRGLIGLVRAGSGLVCGQATLQECILLAKKSGQRWVFRSRSCSFRSTFNKHGCRATDVNLLGYKNIYAWILRDVVLYKTPHECVYGDGAVIWTNLNK